MDIKLEGVKKMVRAADYLSAAQIYLQDNFLLQQPINVDHIKPRLLGHWGTCPGINFVYAHANFLIQKHDLDMIFLLGPGHGFPAIQANLFIEGTLSKYYPEVTQDDAGVAHMCKNFSWPYGFPSHSNPTAPGVILEGGELGYALSTAYGSILDNPNLISVCLIGDGEAETGPIATAWHLNKLIDPATNGAVLPILHVNGYKISGPTFFGRMTDDELNNLFRGYGYEPHIVDAYIETDVHEKMAYVMELSLSRIKDTQEKARVGDHSERPLFPMIVLRTPKGWNSIPELKGERIEDNHLSHQVIAKNARTDRDERLALEEWLQSYNFNELFRDGAFDEEVSALIPREEKRMGDSKHTMGGEPFYQPLHLPDPAQFAAEFSSPGNEDNSSMRRVGAYLNEVFALNEEAKNFRLMSPDETYSNRLDEVFRSTKRAFVWPHKEWDKDMAWDGRVMEMLSEHSLQGLAQGYILTGRHTVFASYEAFIQIVSSMADQYAKFLAVARTTDFRGDVPSLNYILTSSGWRQDHNGFSHQNPGFVDDMLQRQGCFVNVYFPVDGNSSLAVIDHCLRSKNEINIIVAGKQIQPQWRSLDEAKADLQEGLRIWDFASHDDPDIVVAAVGDYLTEEALAAVALIREEAPEIELRFVNIMSLSALGIGHSTCRVMLHDFEHYFTKDKPVIFNFHGYPQTIKQILFDYGGDHKRFTVNGYEEEGSTTTPFDMQVRNGTSRYNLAHDILERAAEESVIPEDRKEQLIEKFQTKLHEHKEYIKEHGVDPDYIESWRWPDATS